jgi:hypothetical protein
VSGQQEPLAAADEQVGISVIATWFGVTRAAVQHWLERHPDFPAPDVRIRQFSGPSAKPSYVYGWRPDREAEIREWESNRPGQGAGGGRPWPAKTPSDATSQPRATT